MNIFLSKYLKNIDKKGRVPIPAGFRAFLKSQTEIIIYPSFKNKCLKACNTDYLEKLNKIISTLDLYLKRHDIFEIMILAESINLSIDSKSKISLPKNFLNIIKLTNQIYLIIKRSIFQLWNSKKFDYHLLQARTIATENQAILKNLL